jgi:hypothetical protein
MAATRGETMIVIDFEEKVWEAEGIRIVVRAPVNTVVGDYDCQNAAQETWRVTQWLDSRVYPKLNGHEVTAIQGDGEEPHGRVFLRTLRQSYYA